jgi:hypothetical protein
LHGRILAWHCNKCKTNLDFRRFPSVGLVNKVQTIDKPPGATMTHEAFEATTPPHLHDLAKAEAERLRRQAMRDVGSQAADDFWRGADAVYQRCLEASHTLAERSATRLQARLARRARDRDAPTFTVTTGV